LHAKETQRIERLRHDARRIREWLADHLEDRKGSRGLVRKSNRTDNDSAKMATSKGVIQGYTGVVAVDSKHQAIARAQAHGTGSEREQLLSTVHALAEVPAPDTLITADAGYHSEANLAALAQMQRDALIPDNGMRSRDERFDDSAKYIDSVEGRAQYGRRVATVEPVFANLRDNKQLNRFTLRGQAKVDGRWKHFALVHNIEKLAHHGCAQ